MVVEFTCPECKARNTVRLGFAQRRGTCAFCGAQATLSRKWSSKSWLVVLVQVCVCFLLCGGVVALLLPAVQGAKEEGRFAWCNNQLKQINFALVNYQSDHGHFPPASDETGSHPVSWRVAILPYLDQSSLYNQIKANGAWNSPKNLALVNQMPPIYHCPSDSAAGGGETSYVMITGENTIGGTRGSSGVSPIQIQGSRSKTIMLVEVHGLKIPWTEPRDITLDELVQRLRTSGGQIAHVKGFNVGMADGSVRQFSTGIDVETLRRLADINEQKLVTVDGL